jgi:hypothetical protein
LIKGLIRRTVDDVITIGQALIRQKAALPHGSFLPWIDAEFAMSETDLNASALHELAAPSTPSEVGW